MKNIILLMVFSMSLFGVQAYQGEIEFKQSDNSTFKAKLKGDEWFSWVETQEGYVVKYNSSSKDYEYMIVDSKEELIFSNVKVPEDSSDNAGASKSSAYLPSEIKKIPAEVLGKIWKKAWDKEQALRLKK